MPAIPPARPASASRQPDRYGAGSVAGMARSYTATHRNVTEAHRKRARMALPVTVPPHPRASIPTPFSYVRRSTSAHSNHFAIIGTTTA
jgi:hypothetical protein